jgi:hypothetical protein
MKVMLMRISVVVLLVAVLGVTPSAAQDSPKLNVLSPVSKALLTGEAPPAHAGFGQGRAEPDSRWNGFVIGFLVGAVPGVILGTLVARYCENESVNCNIAVPFYGGISGLIGGGIGFAIDGAIHDSRGFGPVRPARPGPGVRLSIKF